MRFVRNCFNKLLSFGLYFEMDASKKVAIQIANFDGIASIITFLFYFSHTFDTQLYRLSIFHLIAFFLSSFGIYLIHKRFYDSGRILIHYVGLAEIFLAVDGYSSNSGFEFYYFAPLIVPFVTFTPKELSRSIFLSTSAVIVFITQYFVGNGIFTPLTTISVGEKTLSIGILFTYIIGLFSISRWQHNLAQEKNEVQQNTLLHMSNIAALGVMSGGIAHEINNPLQILIIQVASIKKQLQVIDQIPSRIYEQLYSMDKTIYRIAKIVKSLKSLSRNSIEEAVNIFPVSEPIEDVLAICGQKLKEMGVAIEIKGDTNLKMQGHVIQFSQVMINLLNNASDALEFLEEKWIFIEIEKIGKKLVISVTDSGQGISAEIVDKIMHPFFTTKDPGRGTGLGLSISKSLIEKSGGNFYYDRKSFNTRFVIEVPTYEDNL